MAARRKSQHKIVSSIFEHHNLELKTISPLTDNQKLAFTEFTNNNCMLLLGSAGSGKTFQAIYHVLKDIELGKIRKLIIVRSAVPTKDIGFLPGTLDDKALAYTDPYVSIINELFGRDDAYGILSKHNIIEFMLTSFIRGITLDHCGIIFDECQDASLNELITVITRAGKNTIIHYTGDYAQSDLKHRDRVLPKFVAILNKMPEFRSVYFTINDCVRSGLARSFLIAQHQVYGDEIII
jgi:phosphate starvation-inducible protein PhoH